MSKNHDPFISVIVAVFNGAKTLQQCIDSVAQQTYVNKELIIIDGGSKDGTVDILRNYSHKINFWDSASDRGIYHALNKTLMHATGDWIYILGADDILHDEHVFEMFAMKILDVTPEPLVAYGTITYCRGNKRKITGESWECSKKNINSVMCIPHQGMFHSKRLFEICGNFDDRYKTAGDYHLLLKSMRYCAPYFVEDFMVADQYAGGKSGERASRWKILNEFRSAQKEVGLDLTARWILEYTKAQIWRCVYAVIRLCHSCSSKKSVNE